MEERQMNYYCVIPAKILCDKDLTDKEKILYGHISGLMSKEGYCWATNAYFEKIMDCGERTVIYGINKLCEKRYLTRKIVFKDEKRREIKERHLFLNDVSNPKIVELILREPIDEEELKE